MIVAPGVAVLLQAAQNCNDIVPHFLPVAHYACPARPLYCGAEEPSTLHAVLIGVTMGMLAFLVDIVLQRLNSFKYTAVKTVVAHHGGFWAPYMVWLVFTMGYSAMSAFLVTSFAPLGAGSGIPEIKTYLNGVHIKGATTHTALSCLLF